MREYFRTGIVLVAAAALNILFTVHTYAGENQPSASSPALDASASEQRPAEIETSSFANRGRFREFQLSPDGSKFVVRSIVDKITYIQTIDASTFEVLGQTKLGVGDERFGWFDWAGNDKVLIGVSRPQQIYGVPIRYTRLVVWDLNSQQQYIVGNKRMGIIGDDVIHTSPDGSEILLSMQKSALTEPAVYRVKLEPGAEPLRVQPKRTFIWQWIADDAGVVRIGMGYAGRKLKVIYRPDEQSKFKTIAKLRASDDRSRYWEVAKIVSGSDEGYVLEEDDTGRVGLRKINYSTGEILETAFQTDDWDLTGALLDEYGEPLAAYYTDDRDRVVWLREYESKLQKSLEQALSGQEIRIVSRAHDNSRFLIASGSAGDPGALYIFDPAARKLDLLAEFRPSVDESQLTEPREITYTARDGMKIRAVLTLPRGRGETRLPLIIMPHGGPFGVRDKLAYNDEVQLLANRGYAVIQPNFRGSGGYGDKFVEAGYGQIGRAMQDDLDDAMDWAVAEGLADPSRVCVVGSSYGGYASLFAVLRNPERYRCAASFAGVTDWKKQLAYDRNYLSRKGRKSWRAKIQGEDRELDLDSVSVYRLAPSLGRPVLLSHGKKDSNVPFDQYERFVEAADGSEFLTTLVFDDEGHGFSEKKSEQEWYDRLIAFLQEHNPAH